MQTPEIYVLKAHLNTIKTNLNLQGSLNATLRVGKNTSTGILENPPSTLMKGLDLELTLHIDKTALQTQRCTITFNGNDNRVLGIALITLPKEEAKFRQTYRLIQSKDSNAELDAGFQIYPLKMASKSPEKVLQTPQTKKVQIEICFDQSTMSKAKSPQRSSIKPSTSRQGFEEDGQLQRLRKEKQAYYQLYQIEKAKSEKAATFISSFIFQISSKYPDLVKSLDLPLGPAQKKKLREQQQIRKQIAKVQQLEQANQSLHRQVEQYKSINQKLKKQIFASQANARTNNILPNSGIFQLFPGRSGIKSNIPSHLSPRKSQIKQPQPNQILSEVDLKKWLQQSVGQREQLQSYFSLLPRKQENEKPVIPNISKIKTAINRTYVSLLSRSTFTREALMTQKREVNVILDEILTA